MKLLAFALLSLISWASAQAAGVTITATGTITNDDASGTVIFDCGIGGATAFTADNGSTSVNCATGDANYITLLRPNGFDCTATENAPQWSINSGVLNFTTATSSGGHTGAGCWFQQQVDIRAFTAEWTFVPNGMNLSFVVQNATGNPFHYDGRTFASGAGCEGGFYQGADTDTPQFVFALMLDNLQWPDGSSGYIGSTAQTYPYRADPCWPSIGNDWISPTPTPTHPVKLATSPVEMNSPATTSNTTSGHVISATVTYSNVTGDYKLDLFDVTAGGSCPGASCYSHTWTGIDLPTLVGANTAWAGFTAGCNNNCVSRANIHSFKWTDN